MTRVLSTGLALLPASVCAPDKADAVVIDFNISVAPSAVPASAK